MSLHEMSDILFVRRYRVPVLRKTIQTNPIEAVDSCLKIDGELMKRTQEDCVVRIISPDDTHWKSCWNFFPMLSMVDEKSAVNVTSRTTKRFTFKPAYDSVTNARVDFLLSRCTARASSRFYDGESCKNSQAVKCCDYSHQDRIPSGTTWHSDRPLPWKFHL